MRIGLVGCVKSKRFEPAPAQDLYVSTLFLERRRYVERTCDQWFVLSAKHGLIDPSTIIEPYDVALSEQSVSYRRAWSDGVIAQLRQRLGDLSGMTFEMHAGASYRNSGLVDVLHQLGAKIENPTEGLRFGEQLSFYGGGIDISSSPRQSRLRGSRSGYEMIGAFLDRSIGIDVTLKFVEIEALIGRSLPTSASKYGVWWANSVTNPQSRGWMSFGWKVHHIKVDEGEVRFHRVDPINVPKVTGQRSDSVESVTSNSQLASATSTGKGDARAVVEAILAYGASLTIRRKGEGVAYTPDIEANRFVVNDPFAFLIGVIFDQGIKAERAWAAPYELSLRLGYFNPQQLADDVEGIRTAVHQRPKLHRFVNNLPDWVASAAQMVVREYRGEASNIWNDNPTAIALQRRFIAFKGIGQKKAAMAVELLERDFDVAIVDLEGSDVAFDIHIRRVFLRTGLGEVDRIDDIVRIARQHHRERPGSLDGPAWQIGRRWCRPTYPRCSECVPTNVCPRLIERAKYVRGV